MAVRKVLSKLHLWMSLVAGVFICLLGLSGSALVFENEINRVLHAELYQGTPGKAITYQEALDRVLSAYPSADVQRIYTPDERSSQGVYSIQISDKSGQLYVYVDPGTGKILGTLADGSLIDWLSEFHHNFFLKEYNGMTIVGIVGIFLFLILLTGLCLWWPGIKNWARGFLIRRTSNRYVRHFDLHRVFGIVWIPFLMVVSITGALFPFGKDLLGFFHVQTSTNPPKDVLVAQPLPGGHLPLDELIQAARSRIADGTVTQIRLPKKAAPGQKEGVVEIRMSHQYDPTDYSAGNVRVWVDPYSANVVAVADAASDTRFASLYQTWLNPLHTGRFGGMFTQVLYAIGGVVPTILMATGLVMMRIKASKKKRQASVGTKRGELLPQQMPQAQ